MNQNDTAKAFAALHIKGDPVILYNIWDAGSARTVRDAGARALATGSWSVAVAQGFDDGEKLPLDLLAAVATSIVAATDLPVSIDFEGAYSDDVALGARNVSQIIDAGAVGINFEDQVVGGSGLHPVDKQSSRIRAIRDMADARGAGLFINARTDYFLKETDTSKHAGLIDDAIARAKSYAAAGASSFFAPGLVDTDLIAKLCAASPLPVNIIMRPGAPSARELASLGVARISHGPFPYRAILENLKASATQALHAKEG